MILANWDALQSKSKGIKMKSRRKHHPILDRPLIGNQLSLFLLEGQGVPPNERESVGGTEKMRILAEPRPKGVEKRFNLEGF